jgi:hypothetical protein
MKTLPKHRTAPLIPFAPSPPGFHVLMHVLSTCALSTTQAGTVGCAGGSYHRNSVQHISRLARVARTSEHGRSSVLYRAPVTTECPSMPWEGGQYRLELWLRHLWEPTGERMARASRRRRPKYFRQGWRAMELKAGEPDGRHLWTQW